jgi:ribosome-associated protein
MVYAIRMIEITPNISLNDAEVQFTFIRAPGPGGQNVNKVASAALLRFNVVNSPSLQEDVRARLLSLLGKRLTLQGDLIIKASRYRTQESNKQDALERLRTFIKRVAIAPKKRKKTKPSFASKQRRLTDKTLQSRTKSLRRSNPSSDQ